MYAYLTTKKTVVQALESEVAVCLVAGTPVEFHATRNRVADNTRSVGYVRNVAPILKRKADRIAELIRVLANKGLEQTARHTITSFRQCFENRGYGRTSLWRRHVN